MGWNDQLVLHVPETNGQLAPETRPKPRAPKGNDRKVFQSSIFRGQKLTGFVSGGFLHPFQKRYDEMPNTHKWLDCKVPHLLNSGFDFWRFFRKLTPFMENSPKNAMFQSLDGKRKKAPKKGFPISAWFQVFWFTCTILIYLDVCSHEISYGTWLRDDFCLPLEVRNGL